MILIPYKHEHAARIHDPKGYDSFARKEITDGISAIFGIKDGKSEIQAYRFNTEKFTEAEAKKWLDDHDIKPMSFEKAVSEPKANAELTFEYLKAFYDHVMSHPAIMKELTDEIHIKSRAKAGGMLHGKEKEAQGTMPMKVNASSFGGKVIEANEEITVIPAVLQAEGVRNGALQRFEDFSKDYRWYEGVPIIPEHHQGDPPVSHKTNRLGQIRNVKLNADKRRVEAEAVLFNSKFVKDDLARIQAGEAFPGSIGFYADDEPLAEPQKWSDGQTYNRIERNFFGDHFSIVASPACPLGKCGFNVNVSTEVNQMTEDETKKAEAEALLKANAAKEAEEAQKAKDALLKANAQINEDKITGYFSAFELKMNAKFDALEKTLASKDEEIKTLKAAEDLRQNEAKAQAEAAAKAGFAAILNQNAKLDIDKLYPEYVKSPALWIVTNTKLLDVKGIEAGSIVPTGQAFVPHVNASEEDEFASLGVPSAEDIGKTMKGVI